MFKKSLLALSIAAAATMSANVMAAEESAAGDQYVEKLNEFIDGASLSAVAVTDTRYRQHQYGVNADMKENLNYTDYNVILGFNSGYHKDTVGLDLAGYFSGSAYNNGSCAEISQCDNWNQSTDKNGNFKLTTAAVKLKSGIASGSVGLIQGGVGTIGNVWSFVPGTYRGAKGNLALGDWNLGYMATDSFTAPWQLTVADNHQGGENAFDFMHSLGLTGKAGGVGLDFGIGQANLNDTTADDNTSYKFGASYALDNGIALGYQMYGVDSTVDYDGFGAHHGLTFAMPVGSATWNSEIQYTHTNNGDEFTPRTVRGYGSNNGTFGVWWDALSDWNQDEQIAWSNRASFNFADGWFAYAGLIVANGTNGQAAITQFDQEWAVNGTIGYSLPRGALKGTTIRFHATHLERDMKDNSDYAREDFRFQVIVPYNFI